MIRRFGPVALLLKALPLAALATNAAACSGRFAPSEWLSFRTDQNAREHTFIQRTTDLSNAVVVARIVDGGVDPSSSNAAGKLQGRIEIEQVLKGTSPPTSIQWINPNGSNKGQTEGSSSITISCWPADDFDRVDLFQAEGYRYLLYLKDDHVMRASQMLMGPRYLSGDDEVILLQSTSLDGRDGTR